MITVIEVERADRKTAHFIGCKPVVQAGGVYLGRELC